MTHRSAWFAVLLVVIAVRLASLAAYPLHDTTEARYAEIGRVMATTNEWVVPQLSPGVAFSAKPPLSIWATAASIRMLGPTEFAARLPVFLFSLFSAFVAIRFCARSYPGQAAWSAGVVFLASGIGFIGAGAVMTDAALTFAVTVSVLAFARHLLHPGPASAAGFFLGLALGLLAKGPVAVVLVAIPVALWTIWSRDLEWLWQSLPWVRGLALTLALAGPWYAAAEVRSPGFLEYFLIGEHVHRFIDSGWTGDLYGSAHDRPRGTIWLFAFAGLLPWSILGLYAVLRAGKRSLALAFSNDLNRFLILAALAPLFLFTLAGNILPAYVMPSLAPASVLMTFWLQRQPAGLAAIGLFVPALIAALIVSGTVSAFDHKSQKSTLAQLARTHAGNPVYYFAEMPLSASFYSEGRTLLLKDSQAVDSVLRSGSSGSLVVGPRHLTALGEDSFHCLNEPWPSGEFLVFAIEGCSGEREDHDGTADQATAQRAAP